MNSSILITVFVHLCLVSLCVCRDPVCIGSERETLLKFKHHLKDPSNRLSSWNATANSNCCHWDGVLCNTITSHVSELHLSTSLPTCDESLSYSLDNEIYKKVYEEYTRRAFGGEINPCLVDLKHLNYLDFSGNRFESIPIPSFIATITSLTHLNLSNAGFTGNIPPHFGNLSNLLYLDLSRNPFLGGIVPIPSFVGTMNPLIHLDLSYSGFMGNILPYFGNLSNLLYLDLSNNGLLGGGMPIPSFVGTMITLIHLDLSDSGFMGNIPPQIGNLSNLLYLSMSYVANEPIPFHIGNLSNLLTLNLRRDPYVDEAFTFENVDWLSSLLKLEYLDLGGSNLSLSFQWLHTLQALPSLMHLHLSRCTFSHYNQPSFLNFSSLLTLDLSEILYPSPISFVPKWVFVPKKLVSLDLSSSDIKGPIPESLRNLTLLENLDLNENSFTSSIPDWFYSSLPHLKFLDLSSNILQGTIPNNLGNLTSLVILDLSSNQLEGTIPTSLENVTSLTALDLSSNQLEGSIPTSLGYLCSLREIYFSYLNLKQHVNEILDILTPCISYGLVTLEVQSSQLSGNLTDHFEDFENIIKMDFSGNKIGGELPSSLGKLSSLRYLILSSNQLSGNPFESLRSLSKLSFLDIGDNCFQGVVKEGHFENLTSLSEFYAPRNNLTLKVGPNWHPTFRLTDLDMSSWQLGPNFPSWIHSQNDLQYLVMSNTRISDSIPPYFWEAFSFLQYLNLSNNYIHGKIENSLTNPISFPILDLSSNHFHGKLPFLSDQVEWLDLSSNSFSSMNDFLCCKKFNKFNLYLLNLASNNLSGKIPNCWIKWSNLMVVNLQSNHFVGNMPLSMGSLVWLESLNIRNNSLSGIFSTTLKKKNQLISLDLGENNLSGTIPTWIGEMLLRLKILRLRSNNFSGHIPNEICDMTLLQDLDLAQNSLSGNIPSCFNHFKAMSLKNKSTNLMIYSGASGLYTGYNAISIIIWTKGRALVYNNILGLVTNVDLSGNYLSGEIPREITELDGLIYLNLSKNQLSGQIPQSIGNMKLLESIDISRNQISGEVPPSISKLSFLNHLDLSYNQLEGKIPIGTQIQTFEACGFVGNNLCGSPLFINCSSNQKISYIGRFGRENDKHGVNWFFVSMTLGFIMGFWVFVAPLFIYRSWRYRYFCLLDDMWYKLQSYW
ncbi:hypothetical protein VNO80_12894 [Phaseolus coccineus]|uniref:Leucine-rich repeat-containing N-terminal plant-type domain-containing protein n=1 Tax=Phaseolus coccineus TaxID=3886 RepID=A0AAN9N094_PHACN